MNQEFIKDENGLWIIYRNGSRRFIYVSKLNAEDLTVQKTINIEFFSKEYEDWIRRQYLVKPLTETNKLKIKNNKDLTIDLESLPIAAASIREFDEILNGFIICGKVYFLQYQHSYNTTVRFVFDLYNMNQFTYLLSIPFIQPFWKNTQITYNPFDQKLYAWDSEYLLTYSLNLNNDD